MSHIARLSNLETAIQDKETLPEHVRGRNSRYTRLLAASPIAPSNIRRQTAKERSTSNAELPNTRKISALTRRDSTSVSGPFSLKGTIAGDNFSRKKRKVATTNGFSVHLLVAPLLFLR